MNTKAYFDRADIMERYGVGEANAAGIIRAIKEFNGGGDLPAGKVLPREVAAWESRDTFNRKVFTAWASSELVRSMRENIERLCRAVEDGVDK